MQIWLNLVPFYTVPGITRVNLTRYHGVLAPNSQHRVLVTPAHRGKGNNKQIEPEMQEKTAFAKKRGMTWRSDYNVYSISILKNVISVVIQ